MSVEEEKRYFIIKPSAKRKSFAFVCYRLITRKQKEYFTLSKELQNEVDSINKNFHDGIISLSNAETLFKDLKEKLDAKNKVKSAVLKDSSISKINEKIFNNFWESVYVAKPISDKDSARYDILKAIRLIEPLALNTATAEEIQKQLSKKCTNNKEHRRAIVRLKQLLKFLKRDVSIHKPEEDYTEIQYLTKTEFDKVLKFIEDPTLNDLATVLFSTGVRKSEALALRQSDLKGHYLLVDKQLQRGKLNKETKEVSQPRLKNPKRNKKGRVLVLPFGLEALKRWLKVEDKDLYRSAIFDSLEIACSKAFPNDKSKWVGVHDLRHSHAIYLLSKGASLTQVALNLRNTIEVCQKYYTGYAHTDDTIEALKKMIG